MVTNLHRHDIRAMAAHVYWEEMLPGQLAVRLQACQDAAPPVETEAPSDAVAPAPGLLRWLHRLQFKMGQIELQSSAATQFYSV
ncbi:Uncoordinated protein 79 [Portunus trituberculatus]|uniref:Uncoordinated protein 79 n=1 Tax=Portunus trituberculatus TaxID=210409 RepID=A0A5B7E1R6_PORTR|nr:Uncoordinated protein 79 [Portunus trituberculatus]